MGLDAKDVAPAKARDDERDIKKALKELRKHAAWFYLGEEGERIQRVLDGIDPDDNAKLFKAWKAYFDEKLHFPFEAKVSEALDRGPLQIGERVNVKAISCMDDWYGIIVALLRGKAKFEAPLCDLEVMDRSSANHQIVNDYVIWFANRQS